MRFYRRGRHRKRRDSLTLDDIVVVLDRELCAQSTGWHLNVRKTFYCLHNAAIAIPPDFDRGEMFMTIAPPQSPPAISAYEWPKDLPYFGDNA